MNTKSITVIAAISGLVFLASIFVSSFFQTPTAFGATTLFPSGGGTGSTTLTGLLKGNGLSPVQSVIIGTGLLLSGNTLSNSGVTTETDPLSLHLTDWYSTTTQIKITTLPALSLPYTQLTGVPTDTNASSTLLGDNNTFSGLDKFTGAATTSFTGGISASYLNISGNTASSTFANGIDLASGCFSISGSCLQQIISSASAFKQAVKYASTSTLPSNNYSNGVAGIGATLTGVANGPFYIDGNTPTVGDRVLVKNEGTGANNGIYTVTTLGVAGLSPFVLTRATDYNSQADVFPGVANYVNSGTQNANTCWILSNTSAVTIGTTALTYTDDCGAGSFTATYPIIITGTAISTAFGTSTQWTTGQVAYVNANGNISSTATSSETCSSPLSCGAHVVLNGGGAISIQNASASQGGAIQATDYNRLYTATTTFASPNIYTSSTNQVTWSGLSTTSQPSSSNILVSNGGPGVYGVASSSGTVSSPLTGNFVCVGSGCTLGIQTASASQAGAISASDWNRFNVAASATTTFGLPLSYSQSTNAVTCPTCITNDSFTHPTTNTSATTSLIIINSASSTITNLFVMNGTTTNATSTNFSTTNASTTNLNISGLRGQLLGTDMNGLVAGTTSVGTNLLSAGGGTNGQVMMLSNGKWVPAATSSVPAGSASSTLLSDKNTFSGIFNQFTGGLISSASTTIGIPTATTTFPGLVMIGNAANGGLVQGTTTVLQVSGSYNSYMQNIACWNMSAQNNASCDLVLNNGSSTASSYFAEMGINGFNYANGLFNGERGNDLFYTSSDGGMDFSLASTTATNALASFRWLTKGTLSSNIRMEMFNTGDLMIATTTLNTIMGVGLNIATSTMITGNVGYTYASSTNPANTNVTIDWNTGNTQRVIASTTMTLELNATSSHPLDGMRGILKVCQDSTGGRTVTFNTFSSGKLNFSMGTPTPTTAASTGYMYGMIYDARVQRYDVVAATSTPAGSCRP